jgi:hypothetical protein
MKLQLHNKPNFSYQLDRINQAKYLTSTLNKTKLQFQADGRQIPHLRKAWTLYAIQIATA